MRDILELINKNKWTEAMDSLKNIFTPIEYGKNIFHYACMRGNVDTINKILDLKSVSILHTDNDGNTGAHLLAIGGWYNILIDVVNREYAFLKIKNNDDYYIFNIVSHQFKIFKQIIKIMKKNNIVNLLNFIRSDKKALIHDLIQNDNIKCIKFLKLNDAIDFNLHSDIPPLILAILNQNRDIVYFLLKDENIDVNIRSKSQATPLIVAINYNLYDIAIKLINLGADVNYGGPENKLLPLNLCFKYNLIDIAENIIETGNVDYNKTDNILNIPVTYLIKNLSELQIQNFQKIKKILIKMIENSDMTIINSQGKTPNDYLAKYYPKLSLDEKIGKQSDVIEFDLNNIILPKSTNGDTVGLFNSDSEHNLAYMLYIISTYDKCTIPVKYPVRDEKINTTYLFYMQSIHQRQELSPLLLAYHELCHPMMPHIIFWCDKNLNYHDENIVLHIKKALNSNKRFIILKVSLVGGSISHANIVVYDSQTNIIVRFEPYGDWEIIDSYFLDKKILNIFTESIYNSAADNYKKIKYVKPSEFLNNTKFQSSSLGDTNLNMGDPKGYCLAWCYWFLELKLLNPNINEKILVESALKKIILYSDKNNDNPILSHIRGYAKNLDSEKNKIFEKMGISKFDYYKLNSNDDTYLKMKNYIENFVVDMYK